MLKIIICFFAVGTNQPLHGLTIEWPGSHADAVKYAIVLSNQDMYAVALGVPKSGGCPQ
jgi:hypothetical protein